MAAALAELGFSPAEREVELAVHNEMLETAAAAAVRDVFGRGHEHGN